MNIYIPVYIRVVIYRTLALAKVVTGVYLLPPTDSEDTYYRMYAAY